ncbi:MAG: acyltransferase family protein [Alphaproteobacteria bacterium]
MRYRAEIDGLRAVAVFSVILCHAGWSSFSGGFIGVDVFFVISGYLITTIITNEISDGRFSLIMFYERRVRRILPALFFMIAGTSVAAWIWLLPADMIDFGQSLMAVATFSSNILFWSEDGYFNTASEFKPLLHTWSLAVEEQYYVLFPIGLMLFWRFGRKSFFVLLVLVFITSLAIAHWGAIHKPSANFYLLPTRIWELMAGALCSLYLSQSAPPRNILTNLLGLVGIAMIGVATVSFDDRTLNPSLYTLLPIMGTVFLILFAWNGSLAGRLLGSKPMVWGGLLSYSAYLWHQPLFVFARFRLTDDQLPLAFAILSLVTFGLAWVSYYFVERPFRNRKSSFSRTTVFILSGIGTAAIIGFGYYLYTSHGAPRRFEDTRLQSAIDTIQQSPMTKNCHSYEKPRYIAPQKSCSYGGKNTKWAMFGDSHGIALSYAMSVKLKASGEGIRHLTFSNCGPSKDITEDCRRWLDAATRYLINSQEIKNVVVSYRIAEHLYGRHEGIYPTLPNNFSDKERQEKWAKLLSMLTTLSDAGKQVYFVVQAPEVNTHISRLLSHIKNNGLAISVSRKWWDARIRFVTDRLETLPSSIIVINPTEQFCDTQNCYAVNNYVSLYVDDDHVSVEGAKIIASMILDSEKKQQNKKWHLPFDQR